MANVIELKVNQMAEKISSYIIKMTMNRQKEKIVVGIWQTINPKAEQKSHMNMRKERKKILYIYFDNTLKNTMGRFSCVVPYQESWF